MLRSAPYLFVYGTLMRVGPSPYARLLGARANYAGDAHVPGRLYRFGTFPGAVFDEGAKTRVYGEIYRLTDIDLLKILDRYEGCGEGDSGSGLFRREAVNARLEGGGSVAAWAYGFAGDVTGRPLIASGRFAVGPRNGPRLQR